MKWHAIPSYFINIETPAVTLNFTFKRASHWMDENLKVYEKCMNWRYRVALFHCTEQDQDGLSFSTWELKSQKPQA